jgi:hypothetical protein
MLPPSFVNPANCVIRDKRLYKQLNVTPISSQQTIFTRFDNCCPKVNISKPTVLSPPCGNTVNEKALNLRTLVTPYESIPDLTTVPTPNTMGALWKNDVYYGSGYSTDSLPCEPMYFGGQKTGQIYDQLVGHTKDVLQTLSRFIIFRKVVDCNSSDYNYYGAFLKFRVKGNEDTELDDEDESDDEECDSCKKKEKTAVPFYRYKAEPGVTKKFEVNKADVNSMVIISTYMDGRNVPVQQQDKVVLKNYNYSNKHPETFKVVSGSNLNAMLMSSPTRYFDSVFETNVNANIYNQGSCGCKNEVSGMKKAQIKGTNVDGNELTFMRKKAFDTLNCNDVSDCNVPPSLTFTTCARPLTETCCDMKVNKIRLTAYLKHDNNLSKEFIDGLSKASVVHNFNGVTSTSEIKYNQDRRTYGFTVDLSPSPYKFNDNLTQSQIKAAEDNRLQIAIESEAP